MAETNCCPTLMKPVASGYTPQGNSHYIAHPPTPSTKGVVLVQDIFGNHPNAYQLADVIAAHGFVVVLPDFFGKRACDPAVWPPNFESDEWKQFYGFITNLDHFMPKFREAVKLLEGLGCTSIGASGVCWGSKVALRGLKEKLVKTAVCPHPSFLTVDQVEPANGPIGFLMSKDEAPLLDVKESLEKNEFADKNLFVRYEDLHHGFLGARGPLEEAFAFSKLSGDVAARCAEASLALVEFLRANL